MSNRIYWPSVGQESFERRLRLIRPWPASASFNSMSGCTTCACAPVRARTWVGAPLFLKEMHATIVRGPMEGAWALGCYYVLLEDPDGIRLEVNFVPGAGVRAYGTQFNPKTDYV